jgi:hypothetical protein
LKKEILYSTWFRFDKLLPITLCIVAITLIDISLVRAPIIAPLLTEKGYDILIFSILVVACIFCQMLFLAQTRALVKLQVTRNQVIYRLTWIIVVSVQILVAVILASVISQIILNHSYNAFLVLALVIVSQIAAIAVFSFLIWNMVRWSRSNFDFTVLTYLITIVLLAANIVSMTIWVLDVSRIAPVIVSPPGCATTCISQISIFSQVYSITYLISFLAVWTSSVVLIRNFYSKMKKIKIWILVIIPLVLFFIQINSTYLEAFVNLFHLRLVMAYSIYTILLNIIGPLAGVMAGLVFWFMARNTYQSGIRNHIMLICYGTILLLSLNQSGGFEIYNYPPYGVVSASFMTLAALSIMLGVYFSAIYVAQDSKLRSFIVSSSSKQLDFFANIGTSENRQRTISDVTRIIENLAVEMEDESGVTMNMEENLKEYVNLAIEGKKITKNDVDNQD